MLICILSSWNYLPNAVSRIAVLLVQIIVQCFCCSLTRLNSVSDSSILEKSVISNHQIQMIKAKREGGGCLKEDNYVVFCATIDRYFSFSPVVYSKELKVQVKLDSLFKNDMWKRERCPIWLFS